VALGNVPARAVVAAGQEHHGDDDHHQERDDYPEHHYPARRARRRFAIGRSARVVAGLTGVQLGHLGSLLPIADGRSIVHRQFCDTLCRGQVNTSSDRQHV
jgi:hypothetical protein